MACAAKTNIERLTRLIADATDRREAIEEEILNLSLELQAEVLSQALAKLDTVAELVGQALKEAAAGSTDANLKDKLRSTMVQTSVRGPDAASRYNAYTEVRGLHQDCQQCTDWQAGHGKARCSVPRALLLMRDLVIVTMCQGQKPKGVGRCPRMP